MYNSIKSKIYISILLLISLHFNHVSALDTNQNTNKNLVEDFPLILEYYLLDNETLPSEPYDAKFEEFKNSKITVKKVPLFLDEDILSNLQAPIEYKVQKGDSLESIWKRANIDPRYIVESNVWIIYWKVHKSDQNFVDEWQIILIPNKTWIAYKVQEWDTKESIMKKFNFWWKTWNEYNSPNEVVAWDIIVFPISNERLSWLWKNAVSFYWWNCTWYVWNKLMWQINWWGNANEWLKNAEKAWNKINMDPQKNAIIVMWGKWMPLGHVWIVENFRETEVQLSEMNYTGLWKISWRTLKRDHPSIKWYIHTLKNSVE